MRRSQLFTRCKSCTRKPLPLIKRESAAAGRGGGVPFTEEQVASLADAYQTSGKEGYWRWRLDQQTGLSPVIYAYLGEKDQMFEQLEEAYEERDANALRNLQSHPAYDPLRDDPRFQDLLRRMNLEP